MPNRIALKSCASTSNETRTCGRHELLALISSFFVFLQLFHRITTVLLCCTERKHFQQSSLACLSDMCQLHLKQYERKTEAFYAVSPWIAEFWNTVSNLPFVVIGVMRVLSLSHAAEGDVAFVRYLYAIFCCAGLASAFHHGVRIRWSIVVDWIPISCSIVLLCSYSSGALLGLIDAVSWFKFCLALGVLLVDHVSPRMPVPWGHAVWHVLIAFAIDSAYQSILYSLLRAQAE